MYHVLRGCFLNMPLSGLNKIWLLLTAVLFCFLMGLNASHGQSTTEQDLDSQTSKTQDILKQRFLGDAEATVTIVEYSSFTCPHCARFHSEVLTEIKKEYIDTGKARFTIIDFPLDALALGASMLSRCIAEENYFAFVEQIFSQQQNWANAEDPNEALAKLASWAGLPNAEAVNCVQNQQLLDAILENRQNAIDQYGISSTPTIMINNQLIESGASVEDIASIIDSMISN
ncbi:MAG: DsbA family protein [Pseudomonadota bacterium]